MAKRNKKDVERYVSQIPDREKSSRGYQISLLFYEAADFETAKRYLTTYISCRENVPQAHKLMGQILEGLNYNEQAIASYKRSYEIDNKQKDLILKICELYSALKNVDVGRLKYWVEQAERAHPNSPVVFRLKERIMMGAANFEDMEDFYAKQLVKNYTDVNLHIKLLELYMNEEKFGNAYRHTIDVEKTQAFSENLIWFENAINVLHGYLRQERCHTDTSFHSHRLTILCNLVYLQIKEKEIVTCSQSLYLLDQALQEALRIKSQKPEWTAVLGEAEGMYYFLCGLLLLKRANKGQLVWKDASSFSSVCFLLSCSYPVINRISSWYTQAKSVQLQKFYDHIHLFGCYRLSQAGYIINSLLKSDVGTQLNSQMQQLRSRQARDKLYDIMFTMREMREKKGQSYLIQSDGYCSAQVVIPSKKHVADSDFGVQELFPENLHQLVWLALQKYSLKDLTQPDYGLKVYKFPFSTGEVDSSALESLCQLDIQAFFLATVRCAVISYEEQRKLGRKDQFKPYLLPACLCPSLCTHQQIEWWASMYKFHIGKGKENFGKLRATIQRGLDVIRLRGSHGLSVTAITNIARSLDSRAKDCEKVLTEESQDKLNAYSTRASMYWKEALAIAERLERKVSQRLPKERLFDDKDFGLIDSNQIQEIKDQATFSLATVAMRSGDIEEAKSMFESVKTPLASFYLAKIYRDMSENTDSIGLGSDRLTLMERSYDTLYLTLDRLKSQKNQELETSVLAEIDDVANELEGLRNAGASLVDSICNTNGSNGMPQPSTIYAEEEASGEEYVSFNTPQGSDQPRLGPQATSASPGFVASTPAVKFRTPTKSPGSVPLRLSMEVSQRERPSPERLEARIWALEKKQETVIDLVQDMKNEHTELKQAIKGLKDEYGDLMKQMKDLILGQRVQSVPPQVFPTPYPGSMYRPPPYPYQPQSPLISMSAAYGYPMSASPGPATRPIPSRVTRGYTAQPEVEEEYCDGEYYEDDGTGHGMFGQDNSGWTVNHRPGTDMSSLGFPVPTQTLPQSMPPAGFFAQAVRGQALQFQQGQMLAGQAGRQGSPLISSGLLTMTGTQQSHVSPAGVQPQISGQGQPTKVQGQLADLLSSDSTQQRMEKPNISPVQKQGEVQKPSFGMAPTVGGTSTVSTPGSMPLLSSLMAASTSPDKPVGSIPTVISAAPGSITPKGSFAFGQNPAASVGKSSPFHFGQTSSSGVAADNIFSPQKTQQPGSRTSIFTLPQAGVGATKPTSKETSPVKSPSKTGDDHVEEYEPNVDFKPVIDLPDLVETKTGEEDEEVMFCERAKLFRFDDNQWKERGIGDMKFLRHKETRRVRILMRREQVLKICANHYLTKDIKLSPLQSSKNAWCWTAQDFSDGEMQVEKLAVKFKDEDVAARFKSTLEKLQVELDQVKPEQQKPSVKSGVTSDKPLLGSVFKVEQGSWTCNTCMINNKSDVQKCVACNTLKPGLKPEDVKQTDSKPSSFTCNKTGGFMLGTKTAEQKREGSGGFTFQSTGTSAEGIKFGQTAKADSTTGGFKIPGQTLPIAAKADSSNGGFKLGGQSTFVNKPDSTSGVTFGQTKAKPDSTGAGAGVKGQTPGTTSGFKFGQTEAVKTAEADTTKPPSGGFKFGQLPETDSTKPPLSGGFKFGQLPEADKNKPAQSQFTFNQSTTSEPQVKSAVNQGKATLGGFTFQQTGQQSGFSFGSDKGAADTNKDKPVSFTFKPSLTPSTTTTETTESKDKRLTQTGGAKQETVKKDEKKGFGSQFKPEEGSWKCEQCLIMNSKDKLKCSACSQLKPGVTKEQAKAAEPVPTKKEEKKGFGNLFTPKTGSWTCEGCYCSNAGDQLQCPACNTLKPGVKKEDLPKQPEKSSAFSSTGGGFTIGSKGGFTFNSDNKTDSSKTSGFSIPPASESKPASGGFSFIPTKTIETKPSVFTVPPASGGFSFTSTKTTETKPSGFTVPPALESKPASDGFSFTSTKTTETKPTGFTVPPALESKPASDGFSFTSTKTTETKPSGFTVPPSSESKPASGGFTFTPNKASPDNTKDDNTSKGFNFSLQPSTTPEKTSGFNFTMSPSKSSEPKSPDVDGMYVNKDGEDDHIHFEPVIDLPDKVNVVTGEEDYETLFQHRAKLFRFTEGEWKERGLGEIKISKHKDSGRVRLLMRREQILKICLNHYLIKELELKPMPKADGKAWIWFAMDFSDDEPETRQFAIKFKNKDIADNFKTSFDNAKDNLSMSSSTSPQKSLSKSISEDVTEGDSNDVVFVKEEKATEEQIRMARKYKLPDHFYLYENKPPCPGCIGCDDYEPGKTLASPKHKENKAEASQPGVNVGSIFGVPTTEVKGGVFGGSGTTTEVKGGVFGGSGSSVSFSFSSLAKQTETASSGAFSSGTGVSFAELAKQTDSSTSMFGGNSGHGSGSGFSFSDLAKQADSSTSPSFKVQDHNKQFSWAGTGQKLFGSGGGDDNGDDDEGDDGGTTYDPHYDPIIELPDIVDVKTGEEEYEKVFSNRAKLFRFDKDVNQWKEKGIGDMKILQHRENKRYRLILRREQVLKIACNQWLTPEMSFKPLPTSETSWCWVGQDFSDNEPVIEQMAIKFKTIELAQQFKKALDECQEEMRHRKESGSIGGNGDGNKNNIPVTVTEDQPGDGSQADYVVVNRSEKEDYVVLGGTQVDDDEYDDDDDDDYSTEEEDIVFDKRIKFFSKDGDWKAVGLGTLKILNDDDVNGNRIIVKLDNDVVVCNHVVAMETSVSLNKKDCQWSPIDFSTDEPIRKHFRVQFSSEQAAQEFQKCVQEGVQLAAESDISEKDMVTFPKEITFTKQE